MFAMMSSVILPGIGIAETESLLKYNVSRKDIEKYERLFEEKVLNGQIDVETKFHYAFCLVHSVPGDVKKAVPLLEELFKEGNERMKRDCLFYLALAEAKLKHYYTAKKHIAAFLSIEPTNQQAKQLESYVSSRLIKDGVTGMAIVGLAAVAGGVAAIAVGGIVLVAGIGASAVRRFKKSKKDL